MIRHKVLGCKLGSTPASWLSTYQRDFIGLGAYPPGLDPQGGRESDIITCLGMLAMLHLGYPVPVEPAGWLNRGFDVVVDYFCGDWWKADADARRSLDKSMKNGHLTWFSAFSRGLLLGLLSERWEGIAAVCAWVEPGLKPEPLRVDPEEFEKELSYVYLSMAASLRPEPMPGLDALEKKLKAAKDTRSGLLFRAWEAARAGEQSRFEGAFVESLAQFAAVSGKRGSPILWIATHQSVVGLAAMRLGMTLPTLPPALDAVLMTRASLALDAAAVDASQRAPDGNRRARAGQPAKRAKAPPARISAGQVAALIEQFKAKNPQKPALSGKQILLTLSGVSRAAKDKSLDRESVERWFVENFPIDNHFDDREQFLECLDICFKIYKDSR